MSRAGYHPQYHQPQPYQQYHAPPQYPDRSQSRQQQQSNSYSPVGYQQPQRPDPRAGYENYDSYGHNGSNKNGYYDPNEQWEQGYYQDQSSQNVNQQYGMAYEQPSQSRSYHYDERYHSSGRGRGVPQSPAGDDASNSGMRKQTATSEKQQRPKVERILTDRPPSPKAMAWDNPFGAWPKKQKEGEKKQGESRNRHNEDKQNARAATPSGRSVGATNSRPSTSQGFRPRNEAQRPHTSQSYNQPVQPDPTGHTLNSTEETSLRTNSSMGTRNGNASKEPSSFNSRQQPGVIGLPSRPAPQRAATGPVQTQASATPRNDVAAEWPKVASTNNQQWSLDQNRNSQQRMQRDQEFSNQPSYRGAPLSKPTSNENESDMPNFAAITPGTTEAVEGAVTLQKPAYQKQTYQTADSSTPVQPYNHARYPSYTDSQSQAGRPPGGPSFQHPYNRPPSFDYQSPTSRQLQGNHRAEAKTNHKQVSQHQGFDFNNPDYGQHFATDQGVNPSPNEFQLPQEPVHRPEAQRQGYDQRLLTSRGGISVNNTDVYSEPYSPNQPNRPVDPRFMDSSQSSVRSPISGSAHPAPVRQFNERTTSYNYRSNASFPDSDAAHPVPIRPGLMSPPPQQPSQSRTNPVATQQNPHSRQKPEMRDNQTPITVGELNNMRENLRVHPDDHELGLRFAKRLVEAAKVLASEGGRADAKQTQKNRERYIFDAHKVIKKLVSVGYPEAMFYLADCYGQGLLGLQPDPREAYNLYQSAAKLGHAQSAYRVAVCCELGAQEGGGTKRDHMKAVQYYKRAATLGDTPAMYKMGMILLKGLLGQQSNPREAISWLKRAAERADASNPHALHELGLLYESANSRDVVVRDEAYAYQLFKQAADLGYKHSQFRLGSAFEYGLLKCPIDPRSSIAWYTKAASQGEHQSEFALSGWYLTGSPPLLEQNDTEAYLWAKKAAMSGLAKAEYAMGYYTEVGIGVNADLEDAKRWYYRAAAQNHPKARERLDDLKRGGGRMQKRRVSRSNVGRQNEGECIVM